MTIKKNKIRLKVTKETIRDRMAFDKDNIKWAKMTDAEKKERRMGRKPFSCIEGAEMFGVAYKTFQRWAHPREVMLPTKKKCHHCGVSDYMRVSKWINDGTLKVGGK